MRGAFFAFNGLVRTELVRAGAAWRHKDGGHTAVPVYREMLLQVCRDYPGLPDPRTLLASEILFFYEGVREELIDHTRPRSK